MNIEDHQNIEHGLKQVSSNGQDQIVRAQNNESQDEKVVSNMQN